MFWRSRRVVTELSSLIQSVGKGILLQMGRWFSSHLFPLLLPAPTPCSLTPQPPVLDLFIKPNVCAKKKFKPSIPGVDNRDSRAFIPTRNSLLLLARNILLDGNLNSRCFYKTASFWMTERSAQKRTCWMDQMSLQTTSEREIPFILQRKNKRNTESSYQPPSCWENFQFFCKHILPEEEREPCQNLSFSERFSPNERDFPFVYFLRKVWKNDRITNNRVGRDLGRSSSPAFCWSRRPSIIAEK